MSFAVAPEAYDRFMGLHSSQLSAQMADLARVRAGLRVLDVGCGPGALTTELVARLGADAVVAIDPSEPFVAAARDRHPGVDVRLASADAIPFEDDTFDAALAQLVVHFMPDPVAGLRGMARVTRPGGVVAACVWDHAGGRSPSSPFWRGFHEIEPGGPDEGHLPGVREGHLLRLFDSAGLGGVEGAVFETRVAYASFDEWWEPFTFGVGPAGGALRALDAERQDAVRETCRRALGSGAFELRSAAWAARGVVA
jgi:SAM-dependent methyltransferase